MTETVTINSHHPLGCMRSARPGGNLLNGELDITPMLCPKTRPTMYPWQLDGNFIFPPMSVVEEQFRRMAFNIISRNQDDHVKNIAFLRDKSGNWSLAPAYDLTYSFNPAGKWTATHQITMNGKRDHFTLDDFKDCAETASMKRGRANAIVSEVVETVSRWRDYADEAGVPFSWRDSIQQTLRLTDLRITPRF